METFLYDQFNHIEVFHWWFVERHWLKIGNYPFGISIIAVAKKTSE